MVRTPNPDSNNHFGVTRTKGILSVKKMPSTIKKRVSFPASDDDMRLIRVISPRKKRRIEFDEEEEEEEDHEDNEEEKEEEEENVPVQVNHGAQVGQIVSNSVARWSRPKFILAIFLTEASTSLKTPISMLKRKM